MLANVRGKKEAGQRTKLAKLYLNAYPTAPFTTLKEDLKKLQQLGTDSLSQTMSTDEKLNGQEIDGGNDATINSQNTNSQSTFHVFLNDFD